MNENIETTGLEDSIISTETKLESITKNIKKVCNWTLEERLKIGENISDNVEKKTSIEKISKNIKFGMMIKFYDLFMVIAEIKKKEKRYFQNI